MAEPTPGAPGGRSTGPRSATAATFKVDDTALRNLRSTWKGLTDDVKNFGKALDALKSGDKTLASIQARLSSLGVGGGGTAATGGSGSPRLAGDAHFSGDTHAATAGNGSVGAPADGPTGISGVGHGGTGGHGGGGVNGGSQGGFWRSWTGRGTAAIVGGTAAYFGSSMGAISDLNLAYTQASRGGGGSVSGVRGQLMGRVGGYQSAADLLGGVGTLQSAIGSTAGSARANPILQSIGGLATAMPNMGYAGAAQAVGQLYSPVTAQRLRSIGAAPTGSRGRLQTPGQIYQQIQRIVYRGQKITPNMISEGMQPGAPLFLTLQGLGLDEAGMEGFREYALTQANLGGSGARADAALAFAATRHGSRQAQADAKSAGLTSTIRSAQNRLGQSDTRRQGEAERESGDALRESFTALSKASDGLTKTFKTMNSLTMGGSGGALGLIGGLGSPAQSVLGGIGGVGGAAFTWQTLQGVFGGGKKGGARGALKGGLSKAAGMSGLEGTPVFVTNWPGGGFGGGGGGPLGTVEKDLEKGGGKGLLGRLLSGGVTKLGGLGAADGALLGGVGAGGLGSAAFAGGVFSLAAGTSAMAAKGITNLPHMFGDFGLNKKVSYLYGDYYKKGSPATRAVLDAHRSKVMAGLSKAAHTGTWDTLLGNIHDGDLKHEISALERDLKSGTVPNSGPASSSKQQFASMYDPDLPKGDGPGSANSGRGPQTINAIVGMAGGAPPHRVTSTIRPGAETVSGNLSYHATGNAVDFGGKRPGRDSSDLLAINRFFAQKFGAGLKELIYAGPGAITLRDGKPFTYSKAVRDQHHDHVHVAATADSLKKVGGVNVSAATGGTDGLGGAASGGMPGQGSVGSSFSSEIDALAQVLSGTAPAGMGYAGGGASSGGAKASGAIQAAGGVKQVGSMPAGNAMSNARIIVAVAKAMGLTKRGAIIGIATAEQESNLINLHSGDRDSQGLFQQRPSQGWGSVADVTNPAHAARSFFQRLKGTDYNHLPLTVAAQMVQRSAYPNAYAKWEKTATGIVNQIGYQVGAYDLQRDQITKVHKEEMILPAHMARKVRSMLNGSGSAPAMQVSSSMISSGSSSRPVQVTISAPITVVGKGTAQDARDFLRTVKSEMEKDNTLMAIGSGH